MTALLKPKKVLREFGTALVRLPGNEDGDTLVEALAAILIAALGATLLATMVMVSTNVTASSRVELQNVYKAENESVWRMTNIQNVTISFGGKEEHVEVIAYGSTDGKFCRYEDAGKKGEA